MLSIIIPVYQAEEYLCRCLDSVINQTYRELEILLIDDGSKDRSPQICDDYAKQDGRIKVIHKNNEGVSIARNTGLQIATGDYITFVDSDDYLECNMYESMLSVANEYSCDVVMCDCLKENIDSSFIYSHDIRSGYYSKKQIENEYFQHLIMMEDVEYPPTISNWVIVFKNKTTNPRYLNGVRFSEDLLFGAQLLYNADSFYYMKDCTFYHYWTANLTSATHTFRKDKWNDYKILYREAVEYFSQDKKYDFELQLDKMLLFFVYNALGDIHGSDLSFNEKYKITMNILNEDIVRNMFHRLSVHKLPIKKALMLITYCYKFKIGIRFLTRYL